MLAPSCSAMGDGVANSTIDYKGAETACLVKVKLAKRSVIGYCSGLPMYSNLYCSCDLVRRYGESVMSVSVSLFLNTFAMMRSTAIGLVTRIGKLTTVQFNALR